MNASYGTLPTFPRAGQVGCFLCLLLCGALPLMVNGQARQEGIRTKLDLTVESLVRDIFVKDGCNNIRNIRAIGHPEGIGFFDQGAGVIGLEKGIILSTGSVSNAHGPNSATDTSGDFEDASGDRDLDILASGRVYDAVGLEFDFVPLDSIVTFRYVFASEEYCEFVGSEFNDVFGFFISGPGIAGNFTRNSRNVALVPGTEDFVEINAINQQENEGFYVNNVLQSDANECGLAYNISPLQNKIEYDGFTKGLLATLKLQPCETYTLRMVVADVEDNFYDSAVFLEAESFNIGGEVTLEASTARQPGVVREGCEDGFFVFQRVNEEKLDRDIVVNYKVASESEAVAGEDFEPLPGQIVIPAGQQQVKLPVKVRQDGLEEPDESLILELDFPCACVTGRASMIFRDPAPLQLELDDPQICRGDSVAIPARAAGGAGEYTYRWSDGSNGEVLRVAPTENTRYQLTVTDACGQETAAATDVAVRQPAVATVTGSRVICPGGRDTLWVQFTGEPPWSFTYRLPDGQLREIRSVNRNPYPLLVGQPGAYRLTAFRDRICPGRTQGRGEIRLTDLAAEARVKDASCPGGRDGSIHIFPSGGLPPYRYRWEDALPAARKADSLRAGTYRISVTDDRACTIELEARIQQPPAIEAPQFRCKDLGTDSLTFFTDGGHPPYEYAVGDGPFGSAQQLLELEAGKRYPVRIRDRKGCLQEHEFLMPDNRELRITLPNSVQLELGQYYTMRPEIHIPPVLVKGFNWSPPRDLSCVDCLNPALTATQNRFYRVRMTDVFGCQQEAQIKVAVVQELKVFVPSAFSPNNDGHNDILQVYADREQVRRIKNLRIFNRWGTLVFSASDIPPNDPAFGWDGRSKGKMLRSGVYLYVLELDLVNGNSKQLSGDVSLIR